jgi:glycosyltransferase involved in cell wall biosynthesis
VRILYILATLGIGGAEKQVIDLATRMAGRGHTVAILALMHADEEWPVKLPVLRLNMAKRPLGMVRSLRFAKNFTTLFRPDILHSHTFPANIFARILRLIGAQGIVLNTIHNVHEGGWHRMMFYRLTGHLATAVTAVSAAAAERFVATRAVAAAKMSVLTNGIDTRHFAPDKQRRKSVRTQMAAGDTFIWLAVGRLAPAKDYPNLLRAFKQLRNVHPSAELWIAGEGDASAVTIDTSDGEGNRQSLRFLGLRRDIADLMDAADGFVLSSAWEGMPLVIGEAMSMEKPVVATDLGGVRELVDTAGTIVPAGNSEALAKAMLATMAMTERDRKAMGATARARVQHQFSIESKASEWEALYLRVAEKARV